MSTPFPAQPEPIITEKSVSNKVSNRVFRAPAIAAIAVLALLGAAAIWPGLFAPGDPLAIDPTAAFRAPELAHPFGTDESGRDVYTRVIHGAGPSLLIGLSATGIGIGIAAVLGFLAGLGPHWLDGAISRLCDVALAFPSLVLALLVMTIAGPGLLSATVAVGLSAAPGYARIIRARVREVSGAGYIEYARVQGRSRALILRRHLLPNVTRPLLAMVTLGVGQSIVWVSSLSFLGLGAVPPEAEWGAMLSAGRGYIVNFPWLTLFPGLFIVLTAVAATVCGRALGGSRTTASDRSAS